MKKLPKRFESIPEIKDGRCYLVMIMNFWGKSPTLLGALQQIQKAGGNMTAKTRCKVWDVEPKAYVDDMGGVNWHTEDGCRELAVFK